MSGETQNPSPALTFSDAVTAGHTLTVSIVGETVFAGRIIPPEADRNQRSCPDSSLLAFGLAVLNGEAS